MAGPRPEKVAVIEEVREHLDKAGAAILTEYRGLKVGDLATLRRQLRTAGAEYKIFKNTLVRRATTGTERAALAPLLEGPTAIAFVRDDVGAVAKVLRDFSRLHPELVVKGGLLGTKLVDAQGAGALADLPSREMLLAQLAGAIAAPMRQLAGVLQALPRNLAYGLSALIEKRGGPAPAPAEADGVQPEPAVDAAPTVEPELAVDAAPTVEPEPAVATPDGAEPAPAEPATAAESEMLAEPETAAAPDKAAETDTAAAPEAATEAEAGSEPEPATEGEPGEG